MTTISEAAKQYEAKRMKNISEIEVIRVDSEIKEETFGEGSDAFTAKYIEIDGEKYRIPNSVLENLKSILEVKPDLKTFQVKKSGEGMSTKYTVVPL